MAFAVAPLLLSLLLAAAQEPSVKVPPSEARVLRERLADALIAAREAGGEFDAPAVSKALEPWAHAATRRTPEALFAVLREGPLHGKTPTGYAHYEFESAGWKLRYLVEAPKASGSKPRAVLLEPGYSSLAPGASWNDSSRERNTLGLREAAEKTPFADCLIVRSEILERAAEKLKDFPPEEVIAAAFDDLLRDLSARYPVDPDRILLTGYGETGSYAWYLARAQPDRWAGLVITGARAVWGHRAISNLLPIPTFVAHGEKDEAYPVAEARLACAALEEIGGRVRFLEVAGGGTGSAYDKLREGLTWAIEEGPRNPFPRVLDHRFSTLRNPRAFWIRAEALAQENDGYGRSHPTARVQAVVDGQTIRLTVQGVPRLTLSLAPELLVLTQPVIVEWNGARVFEGAVAADLAGALSQTLTTGDWRSCGLARLTLSAPIP